jgi:hypothetical protein
MILQVWFRPDDAACRIVAVGDDDAKLLARALSLLILAYQVGDSWMYIQTMAGLHVTGDRGRRSSSTTCIARSRICPSSGSRATPPRAG